MLSKLLVTVAIVIVAALFLKQRGHAAQPSPDGISGPASNSAKDGSQKNSQQSPSENSSEMRFAAYLFLALMLGLGGIMFLQDWRDARTVVTIKLYRENAPEPVIYRAYKGELQSRAFTTLDGMRVVVAGDERMELSGLED